MLLEQTCVASTPSWLSGDMALHLSEQPELTQPFSLPTTYFLDAEHCCAHAEGAAWRVSRSPQAMGADVSLSQAHPTHIYWWIVQSVSMY